MNDAQNTAGAARPCDPAGVDGVAVGSCAAGFTIIELVVVLLIVGVLAVTAVPSLLGKGVFDSRGFSDQISAALRFAQKAAISERRAVCAAFGTNSLTLTIAPNAGSAVCTTNLTGPSGAAPYSVSSATVAFTSVPTNFQFNALGQANVGQTISVTGATGSITIEPDTGYVHP